MSAPFANAPVASPEVSLPVSTNAPERRVWKVGTLTYTAGGLAVLFCWLLWGDFAWQMRERSVGPVFQVMLKQFSASDFITGLLLASLPAALTMIIGPVVCFRSDRHRSPRGRRIPFLLWSTPFAAGAMMLLAASPWLGERLHVALGASSPGANVCVLIVMGLILTVFEVASVASNALFGALVNDVVPKEMLGRFFGLFRACSLLAGIFFNKSLFAHSDEHYVEIFLGLGLLFGLGFTLMCLKVKEGDYPPPPPPDPSRPPGFISACRVYWRECCTSSYYIIAFVVHGVALLSFLPINLYSVYYADSVGMTRQSYGDHLAVTYVCSLGLAYFLGWLADKFHPLRMGLVSLGLYVVVMIWGGLVATDPKHFGVAFVAHGVISGMYLTTTASLHSRLFPRNRFAQFASAAALLASLLSVLFPLALGKVLDVTGRDYQQTFFWGAVLAAFGVAGLCVLHGRWRRLGGPHNYQPPAVD